MQQLGQKERGELIYINMACYEKILNLLLESSDDSDKGITRWSGVGSRKPIAKKDLKKLISRIKATSAAKKKKPKQGTLTFPG